MSTFQYRVIWKREGLDPKKKVYATYQGAKRLETLLGPEPWKAYGNSRGYCDERTKHYPKLEYVKLERRTVGEWHDARRLQIGE